MTTPQEQGSQPHNRGEGNLEDRDEENALGDVTLEGKGTKYDKVHEK